MSAMTVVEMFYEMTGYEGADTSSNEYIATSSVKGTYIPLGEELFEQVANTTVTIAWTGSNASSSGNILTDRIITSAAAYFADMDYNNIRYDPETGERVNRHYDEFIELMKLRYGVRVKDGTVYTPREMKLEKASAAYYANENKS